MKLIGYEKKVFSVGLVLTMLRLKYPPESDQAALDKQWKDKPKNVKMDDKWKEAGAYLNKLIDNNVKSGGGFDFTAYAKKYFEIFGWDFSDRMTHSISHGLIRTEAESKFIHALKMEIHNG